MPHRLLLYNFSSPAWLCAAKCSKESCWRYLLSTICFLRCAKTLCWRATVLLGQQEWQEVQDKVLSNFCWLWVDGVWQMLGYKMGSPFLSLYLVLRKFWAFFLLVGKNSVMNKTIFVVKTHLILYPGFAKNTLALWLWASYLASLNDGFLVIKSKGDQL